MKFRNFINAVKMNLGATKVNDYQTAFVVWGFDDDDELTLRVFFLYFTFHKWSTPIIRICLSSFYPLTDGNSKEYWRKCCKI